MTSFFRILIGLFIFCHLQVVYAEDISSVSFFASNNTKIIEPSTAYERLLSEAQNQLEKNMVDIMQSNHMEQSDSEDSIGMYQMANNKNVTSDNTQIFITSPYQRIPRHKAFKIAKEMAITLKQESVAVFIPNKKEKDGDTFLHLTSHPYHINETLKIIQEKLPQEYSNAFSLHFKNKLGGFENATISHVEWLGSKIDPAIIRNAFPKEKITSRQGKAFLVFKNGQKEEI